MNIAIRIDSNRLVLSADLEIRLGRLVFLQIAQVSAVLGFEVDEQNLMLLCHRVWHRSYPYFDSPVTFAFYDWQVLFARRVVFLRDKLLHFIPAAGKIEATVDHFHDHVSAGRT